MNFLFYFGDGKWKLNNILVILFVLWWVEFIKLENYLVDFGFCDVCNVVLFLG